MNEKKPDFFRDKILPILNYIGAIGALITSIAYIILVIVLIFGFKAQKVLETTIFAVVNAAVGFVIMQCLKYQGQLFAELLEENKPILEAYRSSKVKAKTNHNLKYYWIKSTIIDALVKCLTLALTTIGLIYIIIKGSQDYNLIWLSIVNLLMFISFGLVSLVKTYKYFNETYIEWIKEQLKEGEKENA